MIVETVFSWACATIQVLFSGLQIVNLPVELLELLSDFFCYGVWIIGTDLLSIIITNVVTWLSIKFSIGVTVWLWRLLPFT